MGCQSQALLYTATAVMLLKQDHLCCTMSSSEGQPCRAFVQVRTATRAPTTQHLAVADVAFNACVTAAVVSAGAFAVIAAADVIDMGCSKSLHCAIQHV